MLDNATVFGIVNSSLTSLYPNSVFAIDQNAIKSIDVLQLHTLLTKSCVLPGDFLGNVLLSTINHVTSLQHTGPLYVASILKGIFASSQTKLEPPEEFLDDRYHFDFTNIVDKTTFYRGGKQYFRPVGYQRYALDVEGKYNDDIWLTGINRRRNQESSTVEEWPVSYHGTSYENGLSIAEEGYRLSKCERNLYGDGIYSAPDVDVASRYVQKTKYKGKSYKLIMQNRVNPKNLKVVGKNVNGVGEYWISPSGNDIRPYGICIREC